MKKAKMMLLGIAILGTVGTALAFKAKAFTSPNLFVCTTTAVGNGTCKVTLYNSGTGAVTTFPTSLAWTVTTAQTCNAAAPNSTACGTAHPVTLFSNP
jgi:hypothetical protein